LGYFITIERDNNSPDENDTLKNVIEETQGEVDNAEDHMKLIKKTYESMTSEKVLAIYPVTKYEHGNVSYRRGISKGFDYSFCGFYVVTDKTQKAGGTPKEMFESVIDAELQRYTNWCNGEVYGFTLYDEDGEMQDGYGNIYDMDEIKSGLPSEFDGENMEDYLLN